MPSYVVTGASRGIGLEFVRQLSRSTSNLVFAVVRSKANSTQLRALVDSHELENVHILEADLTDFPALKVAADAVAARTGGKLDLLINNAALVQYDLEKYPVDQFPDTESFAKDLRLFFDTNVLGVAQTINLFLPLLRRGAHGDTPSKSIAIGSNIANVDLILKMRFSINPGYAVSKGALNTLVAKFAASEAVREKVGEHGREVVFASVSPGLVRTDKEIADLQYDSISAMIKGAAPEFVGTIEPEESVRLQLEFFERLSPRESGGFYNRDGSDGFANVI